VTAASLSTRVIRGILWTASPSVIPILTQLLFFGSLEAEVTGPFFTALAIVMIVALVGDLGFGTALVQFRDAGEDHFSSAFWINLAWGALLTLLILLVAPIAGRYFDGGIDSVVEYLKGLCLISPCASVSGLFRSRLQRDLRFAAMSRAEILSVVVHSGIAVSLLSRWGMWALVIGSVAREVTLLASLWISAAWRPRFRFSATAVGEIRRFALNFTGERVVGFMNSRLGQILIQPALGGAAAGYYALVIQCTITPLVRISTILHRVSMPAFASIQDKEDQLAGAYIKSIQAVALLLWPVAVGMFLFAAEIIQAINPVYASATVALKLLSLAFILKSVGSIVGAVFLAKGRANWSFRWAVVSLAVLVPSLAIGLRFGIEGVAAAILLTSVLNFVVTQILVHRLTNFSLPAYASGLGRPLLVSTVVGCGLILSRPFYAGSMPDLAFLSFFREMFGNARLDAIAALLQGLVSGLVAYGLALRLLAWKQCLEYWHSLRGHTPVSNDLPDVGQDSGVGV
jgi:O-antigen/teichoic acid export membrane protein